MNFFLKISLKQKLFFGFGIILALMILANLITYSLLIVDDRLAKEIANDDVPGTIYYMALVDESGDMQSNVLEYLTGESDEIEAFEENYQEFSEFLALLTPLESNKDSDVAKMRRIKELGENYYQTAKREVFAKYNPDDANWAQQQLAQLEAGVAYKLNELVEKLAEEEFQDSQNTTDIREAQQDDIPGIRYYLELVDESGDMLTELQKYVAGNADSEQAFYENANAFQGYITLLRPLEQKPAEIQALAEVERYFKQIKDSAAQIFSRYRSASLAEATAVVDEMEHNIFNELESILDRSAEEEKLDAMASLDTLSADIKTIIITLTITTIVALLCGVLVAWIISTSITKRTEKVLTITNSIASGNLTNEAIRDKSSDELSQLADAINEMASSLREVIEQIMGVSNHVSSSVIEINQLNNKSVTISSEQAHNATSVATAIEEMSATVAEVAEQSQGAALRAENAGKTAQKGGEVVKDTINGVADAAKIVKETSDTVNELGQRSTQIGEIIDVIDSIAAQTNLLALNAAIEAARAGEAGRGFSVVADEVRSLAERTTKATQEVSESIKAIQENTSLAVSKMESSTKGVERSVELAQSAGESLKTIVTEASEISSLIHTIATATEEQAQVASEMAQNIVSISDGAQGSLRSSEETAVLTAEVNQQTEELVKIVNKFKLS